MFSSNHETQGYLAVYSFEGTVGRAGIGHAAIWDGSQYYTYGSLLKFEIPVTSPALVDALANKDNEKCDFGKWRKIIIPVDEAYLSKRNNIQAEIHDHWGAEDSRPYHILNKNCAQMVEDYLVRSGVKPAKKQTLVTLRPGEMEEMAISLGKQIIQRDLQKERTAQLDEPHLENRVNFLTQLQSNLMLIKTIVDKEEAMPAGLRHLQKLFGNQSIEKLDPKKLNNLFCDVKKALAEINYAKTLDTTNPLIQKFYATWFSLAITPDSHLTIEQLSKAENSLISVSEALLKELSDLKNLIKSTAGMLQEIDRKTYLNNNLELIEILETVLDDEPDLAAVANCIDKLVQINNQAIRHLEKNKAFLTNEELASNFEKITSSLKSITFGYDALVSIVVTAEEPRMLVPSLSDSLLSDLNKIEALSYRIAQKYMSVSKNESYIKQNVEIISQLKNELNKNYSEINFVFIQEKMHQLKTNNLNVINILKKQGFLMTGLEAQVKKISTDITDGFLALQEQTMMKLFKVFEKGIKNIDNIMKTIAVQINDETEGINLAKSVINISQKMLDNFEQKDFKTIKDEDWRKLFSCGKEALAKLKIKGLSEDIVNPLDIALAKAMTDLDKVIDLSVQSSQKIPEELLVEDRVEPNSPVLFTTIAMLMNGRVGLGNLTNKQPDLAPIDEQHAKVTPSSPTSPKPISANPSQDNKLSDSQATTVNDAKSPAPIRRLGS